MKLISLIILTIISLTIPFQAQETETKKITLQDAIFLALKNNIDIQIEKINPQLQEETLSIYNADFIPRFDSSATFQDMAEPSSNIFVKGIYKQKIFQIDLSLSQKLITGGNLSLSLENSRYEAAIQTSNVNPSLSSTLTFKLTQPLLKNFGTLASRFQIYIAANDYQLSLQRLQQQIIQLIYNVEEAYWNLVYAYQNLDANQKALERARDLLKQNEIKVKVGSAAKIDILQAEAEVARNESMVIQAEQIVQSTEVMVKRILNISQDNALLKPTDVPEIKKINVDINEFLLEAFSHRPEMEQAKLDLQNNNIRVKYYRNQMLPDLQVTASYYTKGLAGDQLLYEGNPLFGGIVIGKLSTDIWDSMRDVLSNVYRNYSITLNLSIPLSFAKEKAQLTQAKLNQKKAFLTLKNTENSIYSEIKDMIKELEARTKLVKANEIALKLQEERLKAEEKKLAVGLATNFEVITAQKDFLDSVTQDLKSRIDYNLTLAKINKVLARTFKHYQINFKEFLKETE